MHSGWRYAFTIIVMHSKQLGLPCHLYFILIMKTIIALLYANTVSAMMWGTSCMHVHLIHTRMVKAVWLIGIVSEVKICMHPFFLSFICQGKEQG